MLNQPESVSGSLGQTVTISCTRSSGRFGGNYVHWYQQQPGSGPRTVIYKDYERPSGVPDRFSGSIDSASYSASLTISGLQPEDEADYYCQSSGGSVITVLQTRGSETKSPRASPSGLHSACSHQGGCWPLCPTGTFVLRLEVSESPYFLSHFPHVREADSSFPVQGIPEGELVQSRVCEPVCL